MTTRTTSILGPGPGVLLLGALLLSGCLRDTPDYCAVDTDCPATQYCLLPDHACTDGTRPKACMANQDCGDNQICLSPACVPAIARAEFSGNQVVPPTCSLGDGTVLFAMDPTGTQLIYSLSHTVPDAQVIDIHAGIPGMPGAQALFTLSTQSGTLDRVAIGADQVAQLTANGLYADVHTGTFKQGEVRGQIWSLKQKGPPVDLFAVLTGLQETPPTTSTVTGKANVTYDDSTGLITYTIVHGGFTSQLTGIHLHGGAFNVAGPHVFDLPTDPASPLTGTLMPSQVQQMSAGSYGVLVRSGKTYLNLHTTNLSGGEIRGQLLPYDKAPLAYDLPFNAPLAGAQVAPVPVTTSASGTAEFFLSKDRTTLTFRLDQTAPNTTAAHLHRGARGTTGADIACALSTGMNRVQGTCPVKASGTTTDVVLADLLNGLYYVDIHTMLNPNGELRGQVVVPAPP